jgi:hypothetical protein
MPGYLRLVPSGQTQLLPYANYAHTGAKADPLRATSKKLLPLESFPVPDPLTPMTMHDCIDRRRPVASRDVVTHEGELKPAAAEQSSGLKRRGKSESAT